MYNQPSAMSPHRVYMLPGAAGDILSNSRRFGVGRAVAMSGVAVPGQRLGVPRQGAPLSPQLNAAYMEASQSSAHDTVSQVLPGQSVRQQQRSLMQPFHSPEFAQTLLADWKRYSS